MNKANVSIISVLAFLAASLAAPLETALAAQENPRHAPADSSSQEQSTRKKFYEMTLEELMEEPVKVATLTETSRRLTPGGVTRITQEEIRSSGARSLYELLDIFVPNVQSVRHHFGPRHLGIRGILTDRDDKFLLIVNDRVMNERTQVGAISEFDQVTLGDIRSIEVVRGAGSAIWGPGAVSGVIRIVTEDASSFQGLEATNRTGAFEEFQAIELKAGHQFGGQASFFLYGGIARYPGAGQNDAPYFFSRSFPVAGDAGTVEAGEPVEFEISRANGAHRDQPKLKFHVEFDYGDLEIWSRYTRGGEMTAIARSRAAQRPIGIGSPDEGLEEFQPVAIGYQQATIFAGYRHKLHATFSIDYSLSYDFFDFENIRSRRGQSTRSHREDEYYARALARWSPNDEHSVAFGLEYSHEEFGLKSPGFPNAAPTSGRFPNGMPRWSTNTFSPMAEHQWALSSKWQTFLGFRADKHTFTDWLFSPRLALVYSPNSIDRYKFLAARSLRKNSDEELKLQFDETGTNGDPERLNGFEFRWERQQTQNLLLAAGVFFQDVEVIAINSTLARSVLVGDYQIIGAEFELAAQTSLARYSVSHGYVKLLDLDLVDPNSIQGISAEPYGFGNDLANWSNHITKMMAEYQLHPRLTANGSLRIYWGFPGAEDLVDFNNLRFEERGSSSQAIGLSDPGFDDFAGANIYLNLGLEFKASPFWSVRLDGYNLLGVFDSEINKRNFINRVSEYRAEAPALAVTARYSFDP